MKSNKNICSNDIVLKPSFSYWIIKNIFFIALTIALFFSNQCLDDNEHLRLMSGLVLFVVVLLLFYRYVAMLLCTKWIITDEQIKIYRGVFYKRINYIELYRVYDYEERQSFIQSLLNNTNIYIYSGDKSTPELLMNGLKSKNNIIQIIRDRVEGQKMAKGIYEFTNNR